jgi:hypothetical protein
MTSARRVWTFVCVALFSLGLGALPARAQSGSGEKHALLIGVKTYPKGELRSLSYTEADIEGLAKVLGESGYRPANIRVMTQKAAASDAALNPTLANIRAAIKAWLASRKEGDSLLLAFAGHGVQFRGSEVQFFCPADAKLANPKTLLSLSEVYNQLGACKAGFKLLLVDACRNDPLTDMSRGAGPGKLPRVKLDSDSRPDRVSEGAALALYSCSRGEKAYEHDVLKHSVFFHFVIQGLRGEADGNRDGKVTLSELVDYVQLHVPRFSKREFEAIQTPELQGTLRGSMALSMPRRVAGAVQEALPIALRLQMEAKIKMLLAQGYRAFTGDFRTSMVTFRVAGNGSYNYRLLKLLPKDELRVFVLSQGSDNVSLGVYDSGNQVITSDARGHPDPDVTFLADQGGDYRLHVRNGTSTPTEAILVTLMRPPLQELRFLRVVNKASKDIRVYLRYETKTKAGSWYWYHSGKSANPIVYTLRPGQSADLFDDGWRVKARRVRIWAQSVDGRSTWNRDRTVDVWLAREGYRNPNPGIFTYTFNP